LASSGGPPPIGSAGAPAPRRSARAARDPVREFLAIEKNPRLVRLAQTLPGRALIFLAFVPLLPDVQPLWIPIMVGAALCAYSGPYRGYALTATTLTVIGLNTSWFGLWPFQPAEALLRGCWFAFALGYLHLAHRRPAWFIARRPVITLLGLISVLAGIANLSDSADRVQGPLWQSVLLLASYLWFLAYALADQRVRARSPLYFQVGTLHPFWGSTDTPYGKGAAYLRRTSATTPEDLAVTQLKAVKLLYWAYVLSMLDGLLARLITGPLAVPPLETVQAAAAAGHPMPIVLGWAALVWAVADHAFGLAVFGHQVVAVARLAGFRLQRNTWRPLESRTLADYWNRYYFYFKELLVDFFFYPTFLTTLRGRPRLRLFAATFMAAGVGNAVYHFVAHIDAVASVGLGKAVVDFESYLFYCAVLATGIGLSQARNHSRRLSTSLRGRLWSFACVWSFVVCIHVFGNGTTTFSLAERLRFMASLFGG
jgi:hypothetical protein